MTTRGWTDAEARSGGVLWRNYSALRERSRFVKDMKVDVSFDTYTFDNRGDGDVAFQMARNAIRGLREIGTETVLQVRSSKERLSRTGAALKQLMASLGYSCVRPRIIEQLSGLVKPDGCKESRRVVFQNADHHVLPIYYGGLGLTGRAATLAESPLSPKKNGCYCISGLIRKLSEYFIRTDLEVLPCCNSSSLPSLGNVRDEPLSVIIGRTPQFLEALWKMQSELSQKGISAADACVVCEREIRKYWKAGV